MEENLKDKRRFKNRKAVQHIFLKLQRYVLAQNAGMYYPHTGHFD